MIESIRRICLFLIKILLILTLFILYSGINEKYFLVSAKDIYEKTESNSGPLISSAVGLGLNWMLKKEYGQEQQKKVVPEGSFYTYLRIIDPIYIRHAIRIGYSGMNSQMPYSLQIKEKEVLFLSDLAFLYNWYVVPVLSGGAGSIYRKISLEVNDPIYIENDDISDNEWIFVWYLQFGVTFPVFKNIFVLEPFIRFLNVHEDKRLSIAFGFDLSYYLLKHW